jgi:ABC-type spermidine/putrescine transport system permease subunit I
MLMNNYFSVVLVMVYSFLPFMVMPLFSTLETLDLSLVEASRDLGATTTQTFFKIIVPLSMPGIRTGFLLVFVPAFGEFVIPMLIGGDKNMYVGSLISHFFFIDQNPYAGGAFTVISSLALFFIVGVAAFFMQDKRPSREVV